jgi:uncharacterized protein YneF (UPF0154 family)
MPTWLVILLIILFFIGGIVVGFIIARKLVKKQYAENPPINANQIRLLYAKTGRKPTEAQIQQIMHEIKHQK